MTTQDRTLGTAVLITDQSLMKNYPDINAVLGGKSLTDYVASGERAVAVPDPERLRKIVEDDCRHRLANQRRDTLRRRLHVHDLGEK